MKYQIRYYTRSGNTKELANAISDAIGCSAHSIEIPLKETVDILFLGCSYYAFDMDEAVKKFIADNHDKIGRIVCFGTSAMMKSIRKPMGKITQEYGIFLSKEEFHCRGKFGPMHKNRPNEDDLKNIADFARMIIQQTDFKKEIQ